MQIRVKAAPCSDPALAGQAIAPKPGAPKRYFTEEPELVEKTPEIMRMLLAGDVIEVSDPKEPT